MLCCWFYKPEIVRVNATIITHEQRRHLIRELRGWFLREFVNVFSVRVCDCVWGILRSCSLKFLPSGTFAIRCVQLRILLSGLLAVLFLHLAF